MSELILPAPLWRRFAAAIYDGLLLIGITMATLLVSLPLQPVLGIKPGDAGLRAVVFLVGCAFFGWFWTRGGQTLGMRAWRLQLRRELGDAVRWPIAAVRYLAMLAYWGINLTPVAAAIILRSPTLAPHFPHIREAALAAITVALVAIALRWLDSRSRLPHDWLSGTDVMLLPRNPSK